MSLAATMRRKLLHHIATRLPCTADAPTSSLCLTRRPALRSISAVAESSSAASKNVDSSSSSSPTAESNYAAPADAAPSPDGTSSATGATPSEPAASSSSVRNPEVDSQFQKDPSESIFPSSAPLSAGIADEEAPKLQRTENGTWKAVKVLIFGSIVAGAAGSAYASYAYSSQQIEEKLSALRRAAQQKNSDNNNLLERIQGVLYSTTIKAVASVAEVYLEIRKSIEDQVRGFAAPSSDKLLPDLAPQEQHVFTLVLDLNETLVYSDWKRDRGWRTFKRPGVEAFLEHLAQYYELVVYSDQLSFYVDPILERLDQKGCIRFRLSRDATQYVHGKHYRDLSKLNRDPSHVMYLSGHATETCLQPENALPIKPWKLETDDTTLLDLLPFLEYVARYRPGDVRPVLASYQGHDIPTEFRERTKEYQRKMQELKQQNRFLRAPAVNRSSH